MKYYIHTRSADGMGAVERDGEYSLELDTSSRPYALFQRPSAAMRVVNGLHAKYPNADLVILEYKPQ